MSWVIKSSSARRRIRQKGEMYEYDSVYCYAREPLHALSAE